MQTLSEIKAILSERGLRPKHRLGQNFLHDHNQIRKLLDAAGVSEGDVVLEVGPGTGTLTDELLARGAQVIACEIDSAMASILRDRFEGLSELTLIEADCLDRGRKLSSEVVEAIGSRSFRLVANLPYQIASPLMSTLLIEHEQCKGQYVTIQREVADRITATPGGKAYGPLTVILQAFASSIDPIGLVPASCFWPAPKVVSAMLSIAPKGVGECAEAFGPDFENRRAFTRFVTELFMKRRKQLGTILGRSDEVLKSLPAGVEPSFRPEALTVPQMIELWDRLR